MTPKKDPQICCPEFNPATLDGQTHVWKDKLFLQDQVIQFLHIPLNMGSVITKMMAKIDSINARPDDQDFLMLCYDPSPWKSEIYMTVTKDIPSGKMAKLTGTFLSKVYDGPYQDVPKWIKDMDAYVASKGYSVKKYFFHYAYCPKCSQKYGHNYCVAFAQIA
jgi:hypothetical protein